MEFIVTLYLNIMFRELHDLNIQLFMAPGISLQRTVIKFCYFVGMSLYYAADLQNSVQSGKKDGLKLIKSWNELL